MNMAHNTCTIEYCNFRSGYLKFSIHANNRSTANTFMIELDDYIMEDGVPKNLEALADRIKFEVGNVAVPPITLLLRCVETYKSISTLPPMSSFKANTLLAKEQKSARVNPNYVIATNVFHHTLGYIYNIYFLPKRVIEAFRKLAKLLNTKIKAAEPFGFRHNQSVGYNGTYANFYICKKVCTMTLVTNKTLISAYDFEFDNERDIISKFLLVISKHEFELAHKKIQRYYVESDEEINIDLGIIETEVKPSVTVGTPPVDTEKNDSENDESEIEVESDEVMNSTFSERHSASSDAIKQRYTKLAEKLLSYDGMRCQITDQAAVFHVDKTVYARLDIKGARVCLYLALDAAQYKNTRYECALSKRRGFETTPCLYRISTKFRQDGAYVMIDSLSQQYGLVPKASPKQ